MQYLIIFLISLNLYSPALANTFQGKVVKIADGDTVTIIDDSVCRQTNVDSELI